jgi:hypothetical protein
MNSGRPGSSIYANRFQAQSASNSNHESLTQVVKPGEDFYFKGILGTFPPS